MTGVSQTMPQARWKSPIELKYLLEEELGVQVRVDNDCAMLALAEKWQNHSTQVDFASLTSITALARHLSSTTRSGAAVFMAVDK